MPSPAAPSPAALDLALPVAELTRRLVDLESVSGHEAAIADAVEAALRALPHLEVLRDGDAVVARTALGRASRAVIAGHLDTVPVHGNLPSRLESGPDGDVLWGRGTVDMKGGCAVMLALAASLAEPVVDVTWVFYDHEEVDSSLNGLGRLARNHPELLAADFAILGEPTGGEVEGGCNGTLRAEIRTRGRRAHSARSWMGENAIHSLAPVLAALAAYQPESIEVDGLVYREGLNAVGIGGGVAGNVIPDEATVTVNYRFAPSRDAAEAEAVVRELFAGFEVEITDLAAGARPGLDDPLARAFMAAVGGEAQPKYGWTDVARFTALGIPAINYGPGDPLLAHADDERVPVEQIERCERGLRAWLTAS
ncbi:MAG TPA: succinyl-diaminopimelate desuccinylase [Pseudolysinimonas sp.]|nr:succinyl-diaminopimelate desuccinylase [Pseudolysinimonas sp.]